jgi:hypothetical protein
MRRHTASRSEFYRSQLPRMGPLLDLFLMAAGIGAIVAVAVMAALWL